MSCHNCSEKPSRYAGAVAAPSVMQAPGDVDAVQTTNAKPLPRDPYDAYQAAQALSYEEIKARLQAGRADRKEKEEEAMAGMSSAMKRVHIETLVSIFNGDTSDVMGMSPNQAITSLYQLLNRDDFSFILKIYPFLLNQVKAKYDQVQANKIVLVADR